MTKRLILILAALAIVALLAAGGLYGYLRASLPLLDGERALSGLQAPVTVLRDATGAPTVKAENRADLARATGFLHAQDRFFQMDLMRRRVAGELAALVGAGAVAMDRSARVHGLRQVAEAVLARETPARRGILAAYAEGVNAGLDALAARPPEYALLRTRPEPWRPEDTVLVIYAMYFDLQDEEALREARLAFMHERLPAPLTDFLTGHDGHWDAPLDGSEVAEAPLPAADAYDLRELSLPQQSVQLSEADTDDRSIGSNNWAIGPQVSADGKAWLADDMHLSLAMPNVWYRLRLEWRQDGRARELTGVSLPGAPALVAGSNGAVAWGFTNSYGDFTDLVVLELDPEDPNRYRTADGYRPFGERDEIITVKGGEPVQLTVKETIWGPVTGADHHGRPLALRWIAHDPQATNLGLLDLERAEDLDAAIAIAQRTGVPAQNFVAVDSQGQLGWTIIGRIPDRQGVDGGLPLPWDVAGWDGWLPPQQYPKLINPSHGRLWTANNRIVGGEALQLLGDSGYALGARAKQIRDGLFALEQARPEDLLALQVDDRAVFLDRWRELLLEVLDAEAVGADPRRSALRQTVEEWGGHASVDSVGYRMVRAFRLCLQDSVLAALTAELRAADPEFRLPDLPQAESVLWRLTRERPPHLLDPAHPSWEAWLLAVADQLIEHFWQAETGLAHASWGERNTLQMIHPLSRAVPRLGPWLDMPAAQLPGDSHMPRVQAPAQGASQRLVVSPGQEERSILHLPGGQSGHPLSPYYRSGHQDWVEAKPTPLLPGEARHRLLLTPAKAG